MTAEIRIVFDESQDSVDIFYSDDGNKEEVHASLGEPDALETFIVLIDLLGALDRLAVARGLNNPPPLDPEENAWA